MSQHMPCNFVADLNRHLDQVDAEARRDEAIEQRTEELLAGGYSPFTPAHLSEAIRELDETGIEALSKLLTDGNIEDAGLALRVLVGTYWERAARREAERQIDEEIADECTD